MAVSGILGFWDFGMMCLKRGGEGGRGRGSFGGGEGGVEEGELEMD